MPPYVFGALGLADAYEGTETFTVVRHPYTRAISEYLWEGGKCNAEDLNRGLQYVLSKAKESIVKLRTKYPAVDVSALVSAASIQFPIEVRNVRPKQDTYAPGSGWKLGETSDCHLLPQWMYVTQNGEGHEAPTVLHTETLDDSFRELMQSYGRVIDAAQMEPAHHATSDECELPVGALDANSLALLDELYLEDFEPLGYATGIAPARGRKNKRLDRGNNESIRVAADEMVQG